MDLKKRLIARCNSLVVIGILLISVSFYFITWGILAGNFVYILVGIGLNLFSIISLLAAIDIKLNLIEASARDTELKKWITGWILSVFLGSLFILIGLILLRWEVILSGIIPILDAIVGIKFGKKYLQEIITCEKRKPSGNLYYERDYQSDENNVDQT